MKYKNALTCINTTKSSSTPSRRHQRVDKEQITTGPGSALLKAASSRKINVKQIDLLSVQ